MAFVYLISQNFLGGISLCCYIWFMMPMHFSSLCFWGEKKHLQIILDVTSNCLDLTDKKDDITSAVPDRSLKRFQLLLNFFVANRLWHIKFFTQLKSHCEFFSILYKERWKGEKRNFNSLKHAVLKKKWEEIRNGFGKWGTRPKNFLSLLVLWQINLDL